MVMEINDKVWTILMQLIWKVVRPEDLKLGDHVYRYGLYGLYSHHGIYVGEGHVIHFTRTQSKMAIFPSLSKTSCKQEILPPCPECGYQETTKRGVVKTCLSCFRWDGKKLQSLHRHENVWPKLKLKLTRQGTHTMLVNTKSPHQVVDTACKLHANDAFGNYNLINNNCEHFATFCWTDVRASKQTAFLSGCERTFKEARDRTMKLLQRN